MMSHHIYAPSRQLLVSETSRIIAHCKRACSHVRGRALLHCRAASTTSATRRTSLPCENSSLISFIYSSSHRNITASFKTPALLRSSTTRLCRSQALSTCLLWPITHFITVYTFDRQIQSSLLTYISTNALRGMSALSSLFAKPRPHAS